MEPLPAPGATVYCLHAWPEARPSDKGRAVIYSGRCALLGVVGESGGGARPLRGTDHSAGPRGGSPRSATAARLALTRVPAARGRPLGSGLLGSAFLPPPPPTASAQKEEGVEGKATPLAAGSVRAPGARGGRAPRGPAEAAACVVLFFGQLSTLGEKNICLKVQKKGGGGGGVEKNSKAQTGTRVCKID